MKLNKLALIFILLLVLLVGMASVSAENIDNNYFASEISSNISAHDEMDVESIDDNNKLSSFNDNPISSGKTIVVDEIERDHNEMTSSTIQVAINSAESGDTIIINGSSYVHCHFIVDKKLTIISNIGTELSPCSSNKISSHQGIFYLTPEASGTIIDGFTFNDKQAILTDENGYGILVNGASDVIIRNCFVSTGDVADSIRLENAKNTIIENVAVYNSISGIKIVNSQNIKLRNITAKNCENGIIFAGSSNILINESNIFSNNLGIATGEGCSNINILYNNITKNKHSGVNLASSDIINILSNYIAQNKLGVYVNCNIVKIIINGNFFKQNTLYDIYNDYRVRNLVDKTDPKNWIAHEDLEIINNNYMVGLNERPVYTNSYEYVGKNRGDYSYDAVNDVFTKVGDGKGDYINLKSVSFLGYLFEVNEYVECPSIFHNYPNYWYNGDYRLQLSEITKNGVGTYSISIVDSSGNVATDLSSVPVVFFLNKNDKTVNPKEGDVYKTVWMKNGTATVKFTAQDFNETGNILLASLPGADTKNIYNNPYRSLSIPDSDIPGNVMNTTIEVADLNTYPSGVQYLTATLKDEQGNLLAGKTLLFTINSATYSIKTNDAGQASIKINLAKEKTYPVTIAFEDDESYTNSSAKANVVVKKESTSIASSDAAMCPNLGEYYSITLKDSASKVIANQKVTFTVNGKTYTATTNSKGQAKVYLKFTTEKTYKITIKFNGNNRYKDSSKTNSILVKKSSKTATLTAPKVTIPPKTDKSYTVTLINAVNKNGVSNQLITFKVDGKTYTAKTNANGQASIKVKFTTMKSYSVAISYNGNNYYKKASATGTITVAKTPTTFQASNVVLTPKSQKAYTVTLKTTSGSVLANQKITMAINGVVYAKTTNSKGQASLTIGLARENRYPIVLNYNGNDIYAASSLTKYVTIQKTVTLITASDKTFSKDLDKYFTATLKDSSGNALANQKITVTFNNINLTQTTDAKGQAKINLDLNKAGSYDIVLKFGGNDIYKESFTTNKITITNNTDIVYVDPNLSSDEIQVILDGCDAGSNVEFLGDSYKDISLTVNKALNIYTLNETVMNGKPNIPVLNILSSNINVSNFIIVANSNSGIIINNSNYVALFNNSISNRLDESKMDEYMASTLVLPGYGIGIYNSNNVNVQNNDVTRFESGIFMQDSSSLAIENNTLKENNYGVKYGFGVSNTQITNNEIVDGIGLYTMEVPEGPRGYGIFLNNSAVNVSITGNNINWNHLGISVDANHSTGIVIMRNHISDNVLEGIRFNAGYDLAENAVEPIVTDNAIYRNARGPSMMILGELSANPEGIYGPGQWNDSLKLKIGPNWYGKNVIVTWDYETGIVGYGTMCPRIKTDPIAFDEVVSLGSGKYSVTFFKNGEIASNLAKFELYACLNNQTEVVFDVINGVGTFSFDAGSFKESGNFIGISSGSIFDESRMFNHFYTLNLN